MNPRVRFEDEADAEYRLAWGSAVDPAEVVRIDPATRQHRRLTTFAADHAARLDWQPLQHFW